MSKQNKLKLLFALQSHKTSHDLVFHEKVRMLCSTIPSKTHFEGHHSAYRIIES